MKDIILTGPKHSGKTSVGKMLAELYSCEFTDLDEAITQRTGKTPRQLFYKGADVFQKAEAEAIAALAKADVSCRVLAAGGGIIDNTEAVAVLKKLPAIKVYLDISAAAAWQRIAAGELPPFLKTGSPQETHRSLHERRAAAYLQLADIVIKAEGKTPQEIAAEIFSKLN